MKSVLRRLAVAAAVAISATAAGNLAAHAEYPERPITIVVPFAVGGSGDIFARIIAPSLSEELGQTVVVQPKPGGGGNLGIQFLAQSDPDGYTVMVNGIGMGLNPSLFRNLPYDPVKDIQPVTMLAEYPQGIVISTRNLQARNLKDLVAELKANPGKFNAANAGSPNLMFNTLFMRQTGTDMVGVSYNGAGESGPAMMRGESDFTVVDSSAMAAGIKSGELKLIAAAGDRRLPSYPDVPTTVEEGMRDFQIIGFVGLYAPGGTPADIVRKLDTAVKKVLAKPEIQEKLQASGWLPVDKTVEKFTAAYLAEIAKWKDVVKRENIPMID